MRGEYLNALWKDPVGPRPTSHATMYRDDRWKLVVYHSHDLGELYDLREDPHEFTACGTILPTPRQEPSSSGAASTQPSWRRIRVLRWRRKHVAGSR